MVLVEVRVEDNEKIAGMGDGGLVRGSSRAVSFRLLLLPHTVTPTQPSPMAKESSPSSVVKSSARACWLAHKRRPVPCHPTSVRLPLASFSSLCRLRTALFRLCFHYHLHQFVSIIITYSCQCIRDLLRGLVMDGRVEQRIRIHFSPRVLESHHPKPVDAACSARCIWMYARLSTLHILRARVRGTTVRYT